MPMATSQRKPTATGRRPIVLSVARTFFILGARAGWFFESAGGKLVAGLTGESDGKLILTAYLYFNSI